MRGLVLFALCVLAPGAALARDYTVDDLLSLESYGEVAIAAPEKLVLVEKRRPYREAADFGYGAQFNGRILTRIMSTRIDRPGPLQPLFEQAPDAGYWMAGLSPSKGRLAVYRLQRRRLTLGVVDLRSGRVKWFGPSPDMPTTSPNPVWLDDDELAYISMPVPRLPSVLLSGSAYIEELNRLYASQASGFASGTVVSTKGGPAPDATDRTLVRVSWKTERAEALFRGDIVDFSVSPSGSKAAVLVAGEPVLPPGRPISVSFDSRRHHIAMLDMATLKRLDVPGDTMRGFMNWSADDRLLVLRRDQVPDWSAGYYAVVEGSGAVSRLGGALVHADVVEDGGGRIVHAGWAGSSPVALMKTPSGRRAWMRLSDRAASDVDVAPQARPVGTTARGLWLLDGTRLVEVGSARARALAVDVVRGRTGLLEPFNEGFRVDMNPIGTGALIRKRKDSTAVVPVAASGRLHAAISLPSGATALAVVPGMAVTWSSDERNRDRLCLDRPGRPAVEIDRLNATMSDVDLPRIVNLTSKDATGATVRHWLALPPRAAGKIPMIVTPYPGMEFGMERPGQFAVSRYDLSTNALLLASAGYAVLLPGMPSPGGVSNPSDRIVAQVDAAVDAAVAEGHVDAARIGILGHSFGGYAALTIATRSTRYGAVVASNGPSDLATMHGSMSGVDKIRLEHGIPFSSSAGWVEAGQGGMGALPAQDPMAYVRASPVFRLDRVGRPLMLIGGDVDPVDMAHSERAFMEAARSGADATLVRFWGEGHEVSSPGNVRQYWNLVIGFFDRTLREPIAVPAHE
jgi:dipeptidyl aminopeptidase/acylaminoacyl peptidase